MSDIMLSTACRARTTVTEIVSAVAERARREQTGQDIVEYGAVLLLVAAILTVLLGFGNQIATTIGNDVVAEINKIFAL